MSFSDKYYQLKEHIEMLYGFKVISFSNILPDDVSGRVFYTEKEIHINCCTAESALYTLLHEGGHALSYIKYCVNLKQEQPPKEKRELYAYFYGWVLNKNLNFGVSKETWRFENL